MIRLRNLHKNYTVGRNKLHVLKGIDLDIGARELVAVMGAEPFTFTKMQLACESGTS